MSGITIEGIKELDEKLRELRTDSPGFEARLRGAIRKIIGAVRARMQQSARDGLGMKSDPRNAYKAVRYAVYKRVLGGQVNILDARGNVTGHYYEPPRHPSLRGGNRMKQSGRTRQIMSYQGGARGFILRFLNAGTSERYSGHGRMPNVHAKANRDKWVARNGERGYRGEIAPRNWFGPRSQREMEVAAGQLQELIDQIINDEFK